MRPRSFVFASIVFVLGAWMAWYGWTQRARVQIFHMPPYSPPPLYLLTGLAAILLLILAAYLLPPGRPRNGRFVSHSAPAPGLAGLIICALGTPWGAFVLLAYGGVPGVPFELVLAGGLVWAALTFFLVRRWTSSSNWHDAHRLAVVFGGVVACMLGGFVVFEVGGALPLDWIGKAVLNVAALAWLISLARKVKRRPGG